MYECSKLTTTWIPPRGKNFKGKHTVLDRNLTTKEFEPKKCVALECVGVSGKLDLLDRNFTTKAFEHFRAWASCPECGVKRKKGKSAREHVSVA